MLQAYTMAEKLIAPEFKWQIHEEFVKDYNGLATEDTYRLAAYAFKNLPANSPILQLLVNKYCLHWDAQLDTDMDLDRQGGLPIRFLHGAMRRFGQQHCISITEIIEDEGNYCYSEHKDDDGMGFCDKHRHMEYDERAYYGYFVFEPEEECDETSDMFDEMSDVMSDVDSMATDVEMG